MVSHEAAHVGGEKLKDNLEVLRMLLSPNALLCALLAGLLLRAQLFDLAFVTILDILVKLIDLLRLDGKVRLQGCLWCPSLFACVQGVGFRCRAGER